MFDVETRDPDRLRRSIRLGIAGLAIAGVLLAWNVAVPALTAAFEFTAVNAVFTLVAVGFGLAILVRTWKAKQLLSAV